MLLEELKKTKNNKNNLLLQLKKMHKSMLSKLSEAAKETKTKTKTRTSTTTDADVSKLFKDKFHNVAKQKEKEIAGGAKFTTATAKQTQEKLKNIQLSPSAISYLEKLLTSGLEDDEVVAYAFTNGVEEIPTKPENLPAVINTAIAVSGKTYEPEWHMVRNLPGYLQSPIRAIGRQVFKPFTNTPIENIQVIANLAGGGPNSKMDINIVSSWLKHNAIRDKAAEMKFDKGPLEGYKADVQIWNALGYTFMLVVDEMGRYIYAWPGGRGTQLGSRDQKRLH